MRVLARQAATGDQALSLPTLVFAQPLPGGIICTPAELDHAFTTSEIHCLTRGQTIGLVIVSEVCIISFAAVVIVFCLICRNVRQYRQYAGVQTWWSLIREPSDVYILNLFIFGSIQALGGMMDLWWVAIGKVNIGNYCTAQGAIQQLGQVGVAQTTLVIAIHTFVAVWWSKGVHSVKFSVIVVSLIWLFNILFVSIGIGTNLKRDKLYESPTPYWCWLGANHNFIRLFGEYLWLWITLIVSFISYSILFLWSRGNITPDEEKWWKFKIHPKKRTPIDLLDPGGRKRRSLSLIVYPLVYTALVLPLSVVRWIAFLHSSENYVSSAATITVSCVYNLTGVVDVLLFVTTRPDRFIFTKPVEFMVHLGRVGDSSPCSPGIFSMGAGNYCTSPGTMAGAGGVGVAGGGYIRGAAPGREMSEDLRLGFSEASGSLPSPHEGSWDPNPRRSLH